MRETIFILGLLFTLLFVTPKSLSIKQTEQQKIKQSGSAKINNDSLNSDCIFVVYEKMPVYPGGDKKLFELIDKNIDKKLVGNQDLKPSRCIVSFQIDTLGKCLNFIVLRSYNQEIDSEFIRVLKLMPDWSPGETYFQNKRKKVPVKYTIPLILPYKGYKNQ